MNRIAGLLLFLIFANAANAQFAILPYDSIVDLPIEKNRIIAEGWADYNSSSVFNELPWNIYRGGFISREMRERSRDELAPHNGIGYSLSTRLSWIGGDSLFGRPRMRPIVSLAYRNLLGATFARDVYELAFFGNAHFEDRTADLGGSAHTQITWQSAGFGIQDAVTRSYVRVDLLRGRSLNSSDIKDAGLYTAPDGRVLELSTDANYWRTDTAGKDPEHTNGMGASISGRVNLKRSFIQLPTEFSIAIEDAGFIQWNENSIEVRRKESLEYDGLDVENIFDLDNILLGEEQLLDTFGLSYGKRSFTTVLPVRVELKMDVELDRSWKAGLMVDQRYMPGYKPHVMIDASRRLGDHVLLGASASIGGYGTLRFGLASRFRIGDLMLLEIGSTHVPGFFIGQTRGVGAFASLTIGY